MINSNYSTRFLGKHVSVIIDRPKGYYHPEWNFMYELNYGYIPNTLAPDGEELDAYVLGIDEPIHKFEGRCIAIIQRLNDEDDKLVVAPDTICYTVEQIKQMTNFQEKHFEIEILM
ncbi:MAG: inorganic diphosphatase [Tannerellaceae bacterium]|nr:inorganic diphosphatase [Tannerellaceae bacterium]